MPRTNILPSPGIRNAQGAIREAVPSSGLVLRHDYFGSWGDDPVPDLSGNGYTGALTGATPDLGVTATAVPIGAGTFGIFLQGVVSFPSTLISTEAGGGGAIGKFRLFNVMGKLQFRSSITVIDPAWMADGHPHLFGVTRDDADEVYIYIDGVALANNTIPGDMGSENLVMGLDGASDFGGFPRELLVYTGFADKAAGEAIQRTILRRG